MTEPSTAGYARAGDGKITRELVLTTALEIIDRGGVDALSMRRLGAALEREPMETVLAQPAWLRRSRPIRRPVR